MRNHYALFWSLKFLVAWVWACFCVQVAAALTQFLIFTNLRFASANASRLQDVRFLSTHVS